MTPPEDRGQSSSGPYRLLERFTGLVLGLVVAALGWILARSFAPASFQLGTEETEVFLVVALLVAALGLVSVVALLHTRRGPRIP